MTNPSDFLLEQFDAICEFHRKVGEVQDKRPVQSVKFAYHLGMLHPKDEAELILLCEELEKTVPPDHPFWSTP